MTLSSDFLWDSSRKNAAGSAPGSKDSDFSIFDLDECNSSAKISAVCSARTYGLEANNCGESSMAANPSAASRVFFRPSGVRKRSGSDGHFGSSRSIAIPWRTTNSSIFPGPQSAYDIATRSNRVEPSLRTQRAKIQTGMKFLFEKFATAAGVANVFTGIAAHGELQSHRAALKGGVDGADALAMGMIEAFSDTDERSQAASQAAVAVIQRTVSNVVVLGLGFAAVIAHDGGGERAIAAFESWNGAVHW